MLSKYVGKKLQAWQELLTQTDTGRQETVRSSELCSTEWQGMGGAHNNQVLGMTGLKINQRRRRQVSLRARIWDKCKKKKRASIDFLVVQVPGRCFGKSDFTLS